LSTNDYRFKDLPAPISRKSLYKKAQERKIYTMIHCFHWLF